MSNIALWLPPALKLLLTAFITVTASVVVERAGAIIGALVVTLPVTMWPAYLFLFLDHDAAYLAATGKIGLAVNAASGPFMLLYLTLAQRRGLFISLTIAISTWIALAFLAQAHEWTLANAVLLNLVVYPLCIVLSRRYVHVKIERVAWRWYELPLRIALVCAFMSAVLTLNHFGGPGVSGMIAVYPISTTSTMLLLHNRIGGPASAGVIANGLWGLSGVGAGLFLMTLVASRWLGSAGLAMLLVVPAVWNMTTWFVRTRFRNFDFRSQAIGGASAVLETNSLNSSQDP